MASSIQSSMDIVRTKYPLQHEACCAVAELVASMRHIRRTDSRGELELEARFGTRNGHGFLAGVTRQRLEDIIETMQMSSVMFAVNDWQEEHDFFYRHGEKEYRTRVTFDSNNMTVVPHTIQKDAIGHVDIECALHETIRVSLKKETVVATADIPASIAPSFVRIKQRKQFKCKDSAWAFDFAMSWAGGTKDEAEIKQHTMEPVFEFECELQDNALLDEKSDVYVALTVLLKMNDFLSDDTQMRTV